MTTTDRLDTGEAPPVPAHLLLPVLVLFVGSGAAALIYEVVWFQLLQFVVGATGVSMGILLGTFMGGMGLGSLILPRVVRASWHPLRVYAGLELGIGVLGLALLVLIPGVQGVYASFVPHGLTSVLLRAGLCGLLLIPPTVLMGATLPAVARQVQATPRGFSWMGFFYAANIVGAVAGCLVAGFWLLPFFDVRVATFAALGLNLAVALMALALALVLPAPTSTPAPAGPDAALDGPIPTGRFILVAIALSGLAALGGEVVWTRLLSLLLGSTTYTFSLILAVFLAGLGGGSGLGSWLAGRVRAPRHWFGAFQLLAAASVGWAAYAIGGVLPYHVVPRDVMQDPSRLFLVDLVRVAFAVMPATICWGASFPLAVAAAARRGQDPGRLIGGVYAANTVGAIVGALGFALVGVPGIGSYASMRVMLGVSALCAAGLWLPTLRPPRTAAFRLGAMWAGAVVVAVGLVAGLEHPPERLYLFGRLSPTTTDTMKTLYIGEGLASAVTVFEFQDSIRLFGTQGKIAASTAPQDMALQRTLGHYSALLHDAPKTVLVVGFGAGITAGTFVTDPGVERIVICEIEALTTQKVGPYFAEENHHVLDDPRVQIINDDARHFLLTTDETFDVITSDPIHPWVKGGAALYTEEYFALARAHLRPGGVITQWVPLYDTTMEAVRSELATFFHEFPDGVAWSTHMMSEGYDLVLSARPDGLVLDVDRLEERLAHPGYAAARTSLEQVGIHSAADIARTYFGRGPDLAPWLTTAALNSDRNLRLMYLAGLGFNHNDPVEIHAEIQRFRAFPEGVIVGSPELLAEIRGTMGVD